MTMLHYVWLSAVLLLIGLFGMIINRRNMIMLLISLELVLLAVNVQFVAASRFLGDIEGQVMVFFILAVAACESAIGLALLVLMYRQFNTVDVDVLQDLSG